MLPCVVLGRRNSRWMTVYFTQDLEAYVSNRWVVFEWTGVVASITSSRRHYKERRKKVNPPNVLYARWKHNAIVVSLSLTLSLCLYAQRLSRDTGKTNLWEYFLNKFTFVVSPCLPAPTELGKEVPW